jgi:hypothetical protein
MKNIHLIPTDKPTGMFESSNGLHFSITNKVRHGVHKGYHIYITDDSEIKEGDWFYYKHFGEDIISKVNEYTDLVNINIHKEYFKRITLTTDPDLIKDGVQAIDDEFLEWFVKNPSCERVDVNDWIDTNGNIAFGGNIRYQISCSTYKEIIIPQEEPKKETPEEAAERYRIYWLHNHKSINQVFIDGAKWQQEQDKNKYSEEEVHQIIESYQNIMENNPVHTSYNKWFEQFKKK